MQSLDQTFNVLEADNAPGQEVRQDSGDIRKQMKGDFLEGIPIDFSHGDVDAFPPVPESKEAWDSGYKKGAGQAYTEYRGAIDIRKKLAKHLTLFTGHPISADKELIITPGTQGALFLALGATVTNGIKVAIAEPDYFANRKLVQFFGGEIMPVALHYRNSVIENGLDLNELEAVYKAGVKVFVFSTPNNPTGLVYSKETIKQIAKLSSKYNVTLIVDQLYSRMLYQGEEYTHLRACELAPKDLITIMGPSKTESLSGYRLGVAFGTSKLIDRMERLQAIVSLRAAGYNQAALLTWFQEPEAWLQKRIDEHQAIRDDILKIFTEANIKTRCPQAGSYLFSQLPNLKVDLNTFVKLLRYQAKVTVTPGTEFAPHLNDSIRLNFSQDHTSAVAAAKRIVKMIQIYSQ